MANTTERTGVAYCEFIASKNNWMFREQPIHDVGIDAHMELTDETGKERQLLALQIKAGESWFKEKNGDSYVFRDIDERQYNYWTTNSLPCIIVLYNPSNDMCIWEKLTDETIKRTKNGKGKGFFVNIPEKQVFIDEESNDKLLSFSKLPEHVTNYNFLVSQKYFMEIIKNGGTVKLHSTEWVNKSSGRGKTELIVNDGENEVKYAYPYYFPFTPYTDVFPRLFPWANFSADEDFYEEDDKSLWKELCCYYDREEGDYIVCGDSFDEFRSKLNPMRSIDHAGELAEYMLSLSLNVLGESFLRVDEFLTSNQVYTEARPKEEGDEK